MSLLPIIATIRGGGAPAPPGAKPLFIYSGESNSGGRALNSSATSPELAVRSGLKIFNNSTLNSFDSLQVGVNNLIGHPGLDSAPIPTTEHSWELEMANRVEAGTFGSAVEYIVKTGIGGATIAQIISGGTTYNSVNGWNQLIARVDAAIPIMTTINGGTAPRLFMLYSQAINDAIAGTAVATWKANTKTHFANIRARYGNVVIVMERFESITAVNTAPFNTAIQQIATEMTDVLSIDGSGTTLRDSYHQDYAGKKIMAGRLMDALKANYTI